MCGMAIRLRAGVVRRPSLPLTAADESRLATLHASQAAREALDRLSPGHGIAADDVSEAVVLHSLLEVGLAVVLAEAEAASYVELAVQQTQERDERRATARRRLPAWSAAD